MVLEPSYSTLPILTKTTGPMDFLPLINRVVRPGLHHGPVLSLLQSEHMLDRTNYGDAIVGNWHAWLLSSMYCDNNCLNQLQTLPLKEFSFVV